MALLHNIAVKCDLDQFSPILVIGVILEVDQANRNQQIACNKATGLYLCTQLVASMSALCPHTAFQKAIFFTHIKLKIPPSVKERLGIKLEQCSYNKARHISVMRKCFLPVQVYHNIKGQHSQYLFMNLNIRLI